MSRPRTSESVFRAIADPTRRRMLDLLGDDSRVVGDLIASMKLRKNAASYHLGVLLQAGLVRQQRRGTFLECSLDAGALASAHAWLGRHLAQHAPSPLRSPRSKSPRGTSTARG